MITIKQLLENVGVADALGYPLEFNPKPTLHNFKASLNRKVLEVTDDTQMCLFLAEELSVGVNFKKAYLNWYYTQTQQEDILTNADGLLSFPEMYSIKAPGNTVMCSMEVLKKNLLVENTSKGCGTVMRVAPWALYAIKNNTPQTVIRNLVRQDAYLTHKHLEASDCSEFLVIYMMHLLLGEERYTALNLTIAQLPTNGFSKRANQYAESAEHPELAYDYEGWTAEECLAIALWSFLHSYSYLEAIELSTVIKGDSDSCGAVTGAMCACTGLLAPQSLINKLNVTNVIDYVATCWEEITI